MDTVDASNQSAPAPPAPHRPTVGTERLATRIATTGARATQAGVRLWRSPLVAPARQSSRALTATLGSQATRLQPVATEALRRGVEKALASPLPEALTAALVESGALERMTAVLLKGQTLEHVLDIAEREQVVKRLLEHSLTERFATELGASEHLDHLIAALVPDEHDRDGRGEPDASPDRKLPANSDQQGPASVLGNLARAILPGPDQPTQPAAPADADAQPPDSPSS